MAVNMGVEKISLVDARIDADFTQKELAAAAGVVESTVWSAENGRAISYKSARKIVNALKKRAKEKDIPDLVNLEVNNLSWSIID